MFELAEKQVNDPQGLADGMMRGTHGFGAPFSEQVALGMIAHEQKRWTLCIDRLSPVVKRRGVLLRNGKIFILPERSMAMIESALGKATVSRTTR
ncbi:MAG: hypothetical protein ABL907_04925 [Hyphomicrobium sp.]